MTDRFRPDDRVLSIDIEKWRVHAVVALGGIFSLQRRTITRTAYSTFN